MQKITCFLLLLATALCDARSSCSYNFGGGRGNANYAQNINYSYKDETHCTWTISNDLTLSVDCEIDIPRSRNCTADSLTIEGQRDNANNKFCGDGPISLIETGPVVIKLESGPQSKGGRFSCRVATQGTSS